MFPQTLFTRRGVMTAAAATMTSMLLKAESASPNSRDGPFEPLQKLIDTQRSSPSPIVIPPGPLPIRITGPVLVPNGTTLVVQRNLVGTPPAALLLEGRTSLHFESAHITDVQIRPLKGRITITGLDYSGHANIAAVLIDGPGPYLNLRISDFRISDANYGILRQGRNSMLNGATITNGTFRNLAGDAIEWNVCPHDIDVVIDGHDIQGIANVQRKPFWGIGIGVAGEHYSPDWDPARSARNFTIRKIKGRSLSQLIHVENGTSFTVEDIEGAEILEHFSVGSGLEPAAVACYGCRNFSVRHVSANSRMMLVAGALHGHYIVPCSDFEVEDIHLTQGGVRLDIGGAYSFARLRNIKLDAGSVHIAGAAHRLELSNIDVISQDSATEPLIMNPSFLNGPLAGFLPKRPTVTRSNVLLRRGGA